MHVTITETILDKPNDWRAVQYVTHIVADLLYGAQKVVIQLWLITHKIRKNSYLFFINFGNNSIKNHVKGKLRK